MPNNYQNYIYLYDENMWFARRLLIQKLGKTWAVNGDPNKLTTKDLLTTLGVSKNKARVVRGYDNIGFAAGSEYYDTSKLRFFPNKEKALHRISIEAIAEVKTNDDDDYLIINDPGHTPYDIGIFDATVGGALPTKVSVQYKNKKELHYYEFYNFGYRAGALSDTSVDNFRDFSSVLIDVKYSYDSYHPPGLTSTKMQGQNYFKLRPWRKHDAVAPSDKKLKLSNPDTPFVYRQNITYVHEVYDEDVSNTDEQWEEVVNHFVKGYDLFVKMAKMDGLSADMEYNVTKIGVPYDFQTVLFEELDEKQIGVATKQPKYDKIYNYYDAQYEPVAIKMIESNIIEEKSLPSIYDFLYLPHQPDLDIFLKIPGLDIEDTNLAAINQYLDNFAVLHKKYVSDGTLKQTVKSYMDQHGGLKASVWSAIGNPTNTGELSLADLGWINENTTDEASQALLSKKFLLNEQQKMLLSLGAISENKELLDNDKSNNIPTWVNELKTGLYFSEKSLNIFEEAYDKDFVFPFLVKLNIPYENVGPVSKLLKQNDLLDVLNIYAASLTVPGENKSIPYMDYFGGVINGVDASHFTAWNRLGLSSFRIFFSSPPSVEDIFAAGEPLAPVFEGVQTALVETDAAATGEAAADSAGGQAAAAAAAAQEDDAVDEEPGEPLPDLTMAELLDSWTQRQVQLFVDFNFGSNIQNAKIFVRMYPAEGKTSVTSYGSRLFIWAVTKDGIVIANNFGQKWFQGERIDEEAAIKTQIDERGVPFQLNPLIFNIVRDLSNTEYDYFSFYSIPMKKYAADIHINNLGLHSMIPPQVLVYRDGKEKALGGVSPIQGLVSKLKEVKFKKRLNELFLDAGIVKTPDDIHANKMCHEETLMYEIAKYRITNDGEEYVQSIFLPIADKNQISYYDTQVIPFKNYFYKIFAHKAIVGTRYTVKRASMDHDVKIRKIVNKSLGKLNQVWFDMPYELEPYLEIVRVPYYNTIPVNIKTDKLNYSRIEDAPPLAPQIDFVPYRAIDDEILILMNNSIGTIEQYPKILFEEDKESFEDVALAQDKIPGSKLTFRSDDSQGTFELYELRNMPKNYSDIGKDPNVGVYKAETLGKIKNDSVVVGIKPNRDYYYIARFVDIHDKVSNPTDVFKIRMVHEQGSAPYLTVSVIDIGENKKKEHDDKFAATRNMQKYLLIEPNFLQATLNMPKEFINENGAGIGSALNSQEVYIGNTEKGGSVFGKKFKIRITSKQTGRKMDVNLTVKHPQTIINE